jgi:hypothetical protein
MGNGNPVKKTVDTWYYDGENAGENIGLYKAVTEETTNPNTDYTRYWHGTAGVIRILHLFTDATGIKNIGFLTILTLAAILMILLIRDGKDLLAVAFFLSICAVKIWNVRLSMEYQPAFIIAFTLCILYFLFEKKGDRYLLFLSIAGGTLIAFFDFLTTETMTILLPLILVVTIRAKREVKLSFTENMYFVSSQGIAWVSAYAMCFLTKWSIASLLTGENKFMTAVRSVENRLSGTVSDGSEMSWWKQILAAPAANISILFGAQERIDVMLIIMGIFLIVSVSVMGIFISSTDKKNKDTVYILLILGSVIIVRYLVLNNHSYMHSFFTYRGLISLFMALFSICILKLEKRKR